MRYTLIWQSTCSIKRCRCAWAEPVTFKTGKPALVYATYVRHTLTFDTDTRDISLPFFEEVQGGGEGEGATGRDMLAYWVKVARVQGQTYEKLYSPAAFLQSPEERMRTALELVDAMNTAWYERGDARVTDLYGPHAPWPVGAQNLVTANSSPNETDMPSVRKGRGQRTPKLQHTPMNANDYIKSKPTCFSIRVYCAYISSDA